jgi:5-methylcytosine-specific restriction endonuclease McrA
MHKQHPTQQGSNNHGWKGGYPHYYGPNWHSQRKLARDRDGDTCQDCQFHQVHPRLPVHHIIPFRKFGFDRYQEANQLSNLVTLCIGCHARKDFPIP